MVTAIVIFFILGYLCIALESVLKINKAVPALLMCVVCWTLYACGGGPADGETSERLLHHLGETCEILFFLMGAMTIVEIVDANGGFYFVQDALATKSKRALLWRITFMTFFLSAILDNLTTSIVMVMVLRKLVADSKDRMLFGGMIIIAANAGGAFSPIGDVTTIMLWIKGMISTGGVISQLLLPSLVSAFVSMLCVSLYLKGELEMPKHDEAPGAANNPDRLLILCVGVGGLIFVPIFRMLTGLAPFMGILLALGVLWLVSEYRCNRNALFCESSHLKVTTLLSRIDMATILFFLGILLAVATLQETGVLTSFGAWLNEASDGNHYLVTGIIGVVSSIVDNVPLVAGCMEMYPIAPSGDFGVDGLFWQLLAYCAGVGGSMLIIGSAAGVVVMGLEKISFGWYLRRFTWIAFVGYVAGIAVYALETLFF
ncbi:MAG: sodium:proton antiporter NhaD [Duncaniella sp.]|jgi:Na+/H+ antiporter NhaD/arsenite permease-like protein|uniref:sodium:proton antiporter NhaD n=1 Tax=Duncaniella muricolitica TaxID=2880704 RepID=UPI0023BF3075|nr:sodium:proton antiporter NhaD [Duncaniella muricolitica]MDE5927997.1 sodium:proton antiporter NhaD [Duncaniella sp.]